MSELQHLVSADTLEQLRDAKFLYDDPKQMFKTKFVRWLEAKADQLYTQYLGAGMSTEDAMAKVTAELEEYTAEWKAAARRKAMR